MNAERFDALLDDWLAGTIAADELASVQAALAEPARQWRFLPRCRLHGALRRSGAALASAHPVPPRMALPAIAAVLVAAAALVLIALPVPAPTAVEPQPARSIRLRVDGHATTWAVAERDLPDHGRSLRFVPMRATGADHRSIP